VRHLLTESILLGAIGGVVGVLIAAWLAPALQSLNPINVDALRVFLTDFRLDRRVLAFAALTAIGTSLLFGIAPAIKAIVAQDLVGALKRREQRAGGDSAGRRWLAVLVAAEVAVATALMIGAGLIIRSFD